MGLRTVYLRSFNSRKQRIIGSLLKCALTFSQCVCCVSSLTALESAYIRPLHAILTTILAGFSIPLHLPISLNMFRLLQLRLGQGGSTLPPLYLYMFPPFSAKSELF